MAQRQLLIQREIRALQKVPAAIWTILDDVEGKEEDNEKTTSLTVHLTLQPTADLFLETPLAFTFTLPDNYPGDPPLVTCTCDFTHPNIDPSSGVLYDLLILSNEEKGWSRNYSLAILAWTIRRLFVHPVAPHLICSPLLTATSTVSSTEDSLYHLTMAMDTHIGTRPYMEDQLYSISPFICDGITTLGRNASCHVVADGHGGESCAIYVVTHLQSILTKQLVASGGDIAKALYDTLLELDTSFLSTAHDGCVSILLI